VSEVVSSPSEVIATPKGAGTLQGIGEQFSPDLHTGTGNFTVPIARPKVAIVSNHVSMLQMAREMAIRRLIGMAAEYPEDLGRVLLDGSIDA
jgi:hypothetical protein